jgi:hypothetical protein
MRPLLRPAEQRCCAMPRRAGSVCPFVATAESPDGCSNLAAVMRTVVVAQSGTPALFDFAAQSLPRHCWRLAVLWRQSPLTCSRQGLTLRLKLEYANASHLEK